MSDNAATTDSFTIRPATAADLADIADIHKTAYSKSHFTALLPAPVLMHYYNYFLSDGSGIHVAVDNAAGHETIQAFAVFGTGIPEKISVFKKECRYDILGASLRHPVISLRKVTEAVITKLSKQTNLAYADFILLSIASRGKKQGFGRTLLNLVKEQARDRRYKSVGLFVNYDNEAAINAYFRSGYTIKSRIRFQYYMECSLN